MKKNYVIPETDIMDVELDGIIATSFRDKESEVVSDGEAGSRERSVWDWMEE